MGWAVFSGKLVQKVVVSKLELKNKKVQKNLPKTPNYFLPFEKFRTFALFQNNLKTFRMNAFFWFVYFKNERYPAKQPMVCRCRVDARLKR